MLAADPVPGKKRVVCLRSAGTANVYSVARLVAETFLERPEGARYVRFKDGDQSNCNVSNLEWYVAKGRRGIQEVKAPQADPEVKLRSLQEAFGALRSRISRVWEDAVALEEGFRYYEEPEAIRAELRKIDRLVVALTDIEF
jgi:hypothetical protein